jgi:hypothetical protein
MIEFLKSRGVRGVRLTCHALSDELFDKIAGVAGKGREFRFNLDLLENSGIDIAINVIVVQDNISELGAIISRYGRRGIQLSVVNWVPENWSGFMAFRAVGVPYHQTVNVVRAQLAGFRGDQLGLQGFPPCILGEEIDTEAFCLYEPGSKRRKSHFERVDACADCELRTDCPGILRVARRAFPGT